MNLGVIVEGHGECIAVPILLRRIADSAGLPCNVLAPLRVGRLKLQRPGELERSVSLLADKVGPGGALLVLVDADDDLPCQVGPSLLARARAHRPDRRIATVLATREYEAWFLAAARSLRGKRGLPLDLVAPADPEAIRNAKGWLDARMQGGYRPTTHQAALTATFDLDEARAVSSFDKLVRDVVGLLQGDR